MSDKVRKRIPYIKPTGELPIFDEMEYKENKCSSKARQIRTTKEGLNINIWFDKHYLDRYQHGDNNGKRDGIDQDIVLSLVIQVIKHLLFYSAVVKNFTFLNHNYQYSTGRAIRIVCQKIANGSLLNVPIEVHFISIDEYEITVITAMSKDDFTLSDGQYAIEILGKNNSILKKSDRGKIMDVYEI
jgi:hypothetical protein